MSDLDKAIEMLVPLTKKEEKRRQELETKIFDTVRLSYLQVGAYLEEIVELKLYKSTHFTFKEYCLDVLDMAKRTAYQYVQAHQVAKYLLPEDEMCAIAHKESSKKSTIADSLKSDQLDTPLPANESQARALVGLSPEEARRVWFEAVETAPDGKITAAHVRKTVRELGLEKSKKQVKKAKKARSENKTRMSEPFNDAFNVFLNAVQDEINSHWKTTDRLTVVKHLDGIRGAISENGNHRIPEKGYAIEASNTEKLQAAGFEIFRANKNKLIIERLISGTSWELYNIYKNGEALESAFEELLQETTNLRG